MFWKPKARTSLSVDIHSHLLPGIDDGAPTVAHSIEMIKSMKEVGFEKLITTPHIHPRHPNSEDTILSRLDELRQTLAESQIKIQIEAAAEYYVDEQFVEKVDAGHQLLSFGENFVLVECSFSVKPFFFESIVYKLRDQGYQPVFAHPERYRFLEGSIDWLIKLRESGIFFQVTAGSVGGYYGIEAKRIALQLIKANMADFLGSDLHKTAQIDFLIKGLASKQVQELLRSQRLLNHQLV